MVILLVIFWSLIILMILGSCALLIRNQRVHNFRRNMITKIHDIYNQEIDLVKAFNPWRYDMFNSVSYEKMLWSFHRLRPENYYKDTSFLEPGTRNLYVVPPQAERMHARDN